MFVHAAPLLSGKKSLILEKVTWFWRWQKISFHRQKHNKPAKHASQIFWIRIKPVLCIKTHCSAYPKAYPVLFLLCCLCEQAVTFHSAESTWNLVPLPEQCRNFIAEVHPQSRRTIDSGNKSRICEDEYTVSLHIKFLQWKRPTIIQLCSKYRIWMKNILSWQCFANLKVGQKCKTTFISHSDGHSNVGQTCVGAQSEWVNMSHLSPSLCLLCVCVAYIQVTKVTIYFSETYINQWCVKNPGHLKTYCSHGIFWIH